MISRSLFTESKKLRIFDMDDTLVKTDSYIYVTHKSGRRSKLTPGQYAVYTPKPGDEFDYTDFDSLKNPKIIKAYFEVLRKTASKNDTVYVLTARANYRPLKQFIDDTGIRNVYVVALGDSNPDKKADWIENEIIKNRYDDIYFIDDSPKNIDAVRRRLRDYPNVKVKLQLAKHK
jgi:FMN phosphatase YigB (HAD superfamily)